MKKHLLVTIVALATSTGIATAGGRDGNSYLNQVNVNAASQAVANSSSSSGAIAQGGSVTFNTPASTSARVHQTYGTQTIRSAPQVVAPSMSSGHPCAWAPLSVGVSVVGFGGAFGGQRIDDACLLAQMGVQDASISMIAARNPAACRALAAVGRISPNACGRSRSAAAPVYRTAVVAKPAPRPAVRRAALPAQVVNPAPQVRNLGKVAQAAKQPKYTQVQQLKKLGRNCVQVKATASTMKTVCS